jgi:NAD(P)-dependent dehydrogenase (short-subunit alcohol dehydrogenase family)
MMRIDLTNKRAVVTGSTSGIGFAIAHGLAETGAAVRCRPEGPLGVPAAILTCI